MSTAPTSKTNAPLKPNQKSVLPLLLPIIVILFLWRFSTLPSYHLNTDYPADWTPGCPKWDSTWHTVTIPQVDNANANIYAPVPQVPGQILIQSLSPDIGMQITRYDIATGAREAETPPMPLDTYQWLHENLVVQVVSRPADWPQILLADPMTLQTTRTISLAGEPEMRSKLPGQLGYSDVTFTDSGELRMLVYAPLAGNQPARFFWLAADGDGRITSFRQTPEKMTIVTLAPTENPTTILFAEDSRDVTPTLAWDYLTGEEIPLPADTTKRDDPLESLEERPRLAPLLWGRIPLRISHGYMWVPSLEAEVSLPRQFIPNEYAMRVPGISILDWIPFGIERVRYAIWQQRYTEAEIARAAARSLRTDGLALATDLHSSKARAISGDLLTTTRIELARRFDLQPYPDHALVHVTEDLSGPVGVLGFGINAGNNPGIKIIALPDGQTLLVQVITKPTPLAAADAGLLRFGVIPVTASEVKWLGYVTLPSDSNITPQNPLDFLRLTRVGDHLLCSFGGLHLSGNGSEPESHDDLYWAAMPLPPELAAFPEGTLW